MVSNVKFGVNSSVLKVFVFRGGGDKLERNIVRLVFLRRGLGFESELRVCRIGIGRLRFLFGKFRGS